MTESEDLRTFIREILLRFDRGMAQVREDSRRYFEILDARMEAEARRTDELVAESRAQRQALLHVLDQLSNGGPAAAT